LVLDPDSVTGFSVLLERDILTVTNGAFGTFNVTIENNWHAWYRASALPVGFVAGTAPQPFFLGPGGKRTFQLTFVQGDTISFFADASIDLDNPQLPDFQMLGLFGAEILWRLGTESDLPQTVTDWLLTTASELSTISSEVKTLIYIGIAVYHRDLFGLVKAINAAMKSVTLTTQLTAFGFNVARINVFTAADRVGRVLDFLINELIAANEFPNDALTLTAK
jgi:hypothetical protein